MNTKRGKENRMGNEQRIGLKIVRRLGRAISTGSAIAALLAGLAVSLPASAWDHQGADGKDTPPVKIKSMNKRGQKGLEAKLSPTEPEKDEPVKKVYPTVTAQAPTGAAEALAGQGLTPVTQAPVDPNAPKPAIKADETTHNFGTVWVGPVLKHEFTLRNDGAGPLEISKVRPACGCTIAGTYPKALAPGESGKFPFSLDSNKLRGKFEKGITISSNDPTTPELQLKLAGECQRYVEVTPPQANFSRISDSEPKEQKVQIVNNSETPLQVTLTPAAAGSKFGWDMVEKTPGKEFELTVKLNPPFEPGTLRDVVSLTTNIEAQKSIQVPVMAIVPERLEVQPSELVIGTVGKAAPVTRRQLRFSNYGEKPATVTKAEANDEKLKVALKEVQPGKSYTIEVEWPADYVPPELGKAITLTIDDPTKPTITIPVKPMRSAEKTTQAAPADALIGKPAPAFSLKTVDGKELSNAALKDSVAVLNFFAPNCGYCKKQMPRVETVRPTFVEKGVRFFNVSQTMKKEFPDDEIIKVAKETGSNSELAIDSKNTVGPLFGASGFPTQVVIGKSGNVEAVNVGNVGDLESRLTGQLEALIAGKPIPAEFKTAAAPAKPKAAPTSELIGKPAPEFSVKTTEGKSVSNAELASSGATVLNFVAPTCGYCKKQVPRIETLKAEYVAKGVRFVNVSQKMGTKEFTPEDAAKIFTDAGSSCEFAMDEGNKTGQAFRAQSYPTMVIVGKSGKVEAVNSGNVADLETRMKGQLDAILGGKPVPTFDTPAPAAQADAAAKPQRPAMEMIGKPSPSFSVSTIDGKAVSDADFANHPATILNFWAPNCPHCKKQIPVVETVRKEYEAKGVRFVNVSQTMRQPFPQDQIVDVAKGIGSTMDLVNDPENKIGGMFKAGSFPTMVVVGKDGKVATVNIGNAPDLETKLKGQLDSLIAGKPIETPTAAAPAAVQAVPIAAPTPTPAPKP